MGVDIHLPTLGVVIGSAAIDSINPCAIGVLILMISTILTQHKHSLKRLLLMGGFYIFAIFLTYLLAGFGLMYFLATIPLSIAEYISIFVGGLVVVFGLLEIKDYFWYGQGFSLGIPPMFIQKIHDLSKNVSLVGVTITGSFVAAVELPCTGGPYLAIITLLSKNFDFTAFILMIIYNIIFVMPLVIILLLVAAGTKLNVVQNWKQESKGTMRLMIGLLLVSLGWLLMLLANGTINFG